MYSSKKSAKNGFINIFSIMDNLIQQVFVLVFELVAGVKADINNYGFLKKRSAIMCISAIQKNLQKNI